MSRRNREHLARYEAENVVMPVESEQDAEILVRELAADWVAHRIVEAKRPVDALSYLA
jgi:hypothetical protein